MNSNENLLDILVPSPAQTRLTPDHPANSADQIHWIQARSWIPHALNVVAAARRRHDTWKWNKRLDSKLESKHVTSSLQCCMNSLLNQRKVNLLLDQKKT